MEFNENKGLDLIQAQMVKKTSKLPILEIRRSKMILKNHKNRVFIFFCEQYLTITDPTSRSRTSPRDCEG